MKAEPSANEAFVFDDNNSQSNMNLATHAQWNTCSQVPLRATQASKEMRAMMGVFRIDPFAFHGGPPPPSVAGPLAAPGKNFEWQLPMETPEEQSPHNLYNAAHPMQSTPHIVSSKMGDPSYGIPMSALASRAAAQVHGYDSSSYQGSSPGQSFH